MNGGYRYDAGLKTVHDAAVLAEELVSEYYKMSSSQWLKSRYDVKTATDLAEDEKVTGPFAQVVKYEGRKKDALLKSYTFNYWTVCLQDEAILRTVEKNEKLLLFPFLLYILTHELVHIVRFSRFQQIYEQSAGVNMTMDEERRVHRLTAHILDSVTGMEAVIAHYEKWRTNEA